MRRKGEGVLRRFSGRREVSRIKESTPAEEAIALVHSSTGGVFRSVDMIIPRLLELRRRNEKKPAQGSVKMQDPVKTATDRLMI